MSGIIDIGVYLPWRRLSGKTAGDAWGRPGGGERAVASHDEDSATMTQMTAGIPPDIAAKFKEGIPLKRFADPAEIASAHVFFASEEASYITGQVLFVDGGISLGI